MRNKRNRHIAASIAALALTACRAGSIERDGADGPDQTPAPALSLFSTLPVYWGESADIDDLIDGGQDAPWLRRTLERDYALRPLDALEAADLAGQRRLLMAQPRALAPSENVALDAWVRDGGQVLIFADPLLTRHSDLALGDKRRPADTVMISPILARWGLALTFDGNQPASEQLVGEGDDAVPVEMAGAFVARSGAAESQCAITAQGLIAHCAIGRGHAVLVADAAVLDGDESAANPADRARALAGLLRRAFAP